MKLTWAGGLITVMVHQLRRIRHFADPNLALADSLDNKMDLREVGCDAGDWIDLAQDRVQWQAYARMVMNLCVL